MHNISVSKPYRNYELCFFTLFWSFSPPTIHQQDQQEKEQRLKEAKEWKIQQLWKERENERGMESVMEQTREKEREKDRERETEMLKVKEKQRLDQQPSSNEKHLKGSRGRNVTSHRSHIFSVKDIHSIYLTKVFNNVHNLNCKIVTTIFLLSIF